MQKQEKKYFNEGIDSDTVDILLPAGSSVNGLNLRFATTDKGTVGTLEQIASTREFTMSLPIGTNITIASAEDESRQRGLFFNWNSNGNHGIYCFEKSSSTVYTVLLNSQVSQGLNFSKDHLIHSICVVGNQLYWVNDRLNEPRAINIEAGIKLNHAGYNTTVTAYQSPISQESITLLKRPPMYPPELVGAGGANPGNFIRNFAFQFAFRYVYRDMEQSVLSIFSKTGGPLRTTDLFNAWRVSLPLSEIIPNEVIRVELIVRDLESNKAFVVKSWDRDRDSLINGHNSGTALTYDFYNDQNGIAIDDAYSYKPYDSVPIYSSTIEVAKNRLHLANNDRGYTAPLKTSLQALPIQDEAGTLTGTWWKLVYTTGIGVATKFYIYISGIPTPGYHEWVSGYIDPVSPSFPASVLWSDLVYRGSDQLAVFSSLGIFPPYNAVSFFGYVGNVSTITNPPATSTLTGQKVHKSGAGKRIGIYFDDYGDRNCGVVTNDSLKIITPDRQYGSVPYTRSINWSLSNGNAAEEIPVWAKYYTILVTKCLRTRSFVQIRASNMTYAGKDSAGLYTFTTAAHSSNLYGVGINLSLLKAIGLGYAYNEGDIVKVYIGTTVHELQIQAQVGDWIVVELKDLGTLNSTSNVLVEVYTPFKESFGEPYYEVAIRFPILNAGTINRRYSQLNGSIEGDVWLLSRTKGVDQYLVEAMSPNDKVWTSWYTDAARASAVVFNKETTRDRNICCSNVFIEGTGVNGLSSFDALDYIDLPVENGPVSKLILTSKVQDEGSVMLAICKFDVTSVYLGESRITESTGRTAFLAKADGVYGTVNPLRGGYGTINPESVCRTEDDLVFWIDVNRMAAVFYSLNGITPVQTNSFTRFFRCFCEEYNKMSKAQIEALGSRPFIFGSCDPYHKEVQWSIPKLLPSNPRGTLEDYPNIDYPYDVWDGSAKTIVYKYPLDRWQFPYSYTPEYFLAIGSFMYGFKGGKIYQFNYPEAGYNNFFGVNHKSRIAFVFNQEPSAVKIYHTIAFESNVAPEFVHFRSESPWVQSSSLVASDFRNYEQIWEAAIKRDRLSPNANGSLTKKMNMGDKMRAVAMRVMAEWNHNVGLQLKFANIYYISSIGHKV